MKTFFFALLVAVAFISPAAAQLLGGSVIVTEINFNGDSTTNSGDWFELYNMSASPASLGGWLVRDAATSNVFVIPSGTTLAGNQYLAVVSDVPQFTARFPGVTNFVGPMDFGLGNNGDMIRLYNGDNVLQYSVTYDDTLAWPRGADGSGRTLELKTFDANPNNGESWFDGCMFGSPGAAYQPCNPTFVFSEINYNSDSLSDSDDWAELHNRSNAAVNLTGWRVKDSKDSNVYVFPTVTIPPDGYLVLCNDVQKFEAVYPTVNNKVGDLGFSLSNGGESLRLFDAQNKLNFSVRYNDMSPWPLEADGEGYTLELVDATGHINEGTNWTKGCLGGSPGGPLVLPCITSVDDSNPGTAVVVTTANEHAYNLAVQRDGFAYELFDVQGRRFVGGALKVGTNYVDLRHALPGIYLLRIFDASASMGHRLVRY